MRPRSRAKLLVVVHKAHGCLFLSLSLSLSLTARRGLHPGRLGIFLALLSGASAASFNFSSLVPIGTYSYRNTGCSPPEVTSPGWSTGGGGGSASPFAFTYVCEGATKSWGTGPSAGVGGSGSYLYAEVDAPRTE